jgi:hypothetical protein
LPVMPSLGVEGQQARRDRSRVKPHLTANARRQRRGDLVDAERKRVRLPGERARSEPQRSCAALQVSPPALGQRPALAVSIECDVQGAVIRRVRSSALSRPGVVRREDAADEGDEGDSMAPVVTQGV